MICRAVIVTHYTYSFSLRNMFPDLQIVLRQILENVPVPLIVLKDL